MNQINVSVCIPVYKVEKYIERCAESLFEQTMKEGIEFIFVDDATPDRSMAVLNQVLQTYPERLPQTKILHHPQNMGSTAARETAIAEAGGKYIIFCDSDDRVAKEMYESMFRTAEEKNADMVYCGMAKEISPGKFFNMFQPEYETPRDFLLSLLAENVLCSLCNKLYRSELIKQNHICYRHDIANGDDLLLNIQILRKCRKIAALRQCFYHYVFNPDSQSHRIQPNQVEQYRKTLQLLPELVDSSVRKLAVRNYKLSRLVYALAYPQAFDRNDVDFFSDGVTISDCLGSFLKTQLKPFVLLLLLCPNLAQKIFSAASEFLNLIRTRNC